MRAGLLLCSCYLLCTGDLAAQLSLEYGVGEAAGAMLWVEEPRVGLDWSVLENRSVMNAHFGKAAEFPQPQTFDFTRTAPHLAFFCRLEINEAAGNVIPVKFRLGGHRYWQDDLLRR